MIKQGFCIRCGEILIVPYVGDNVQYPIDILLQKILKCFVIYVEKQLMFHLLSQYVLNVKLKLKVKKMEIKKKSFDEFSVGDSESVTKTITNEDIMSFAEITTDFNPLHVNEEYAKKSMFKNRIAHGMLSAGLISAVIGMKMPGPGALYLDQYVKFKKPVFIGETLTATATVKEKLVKKDGKMKLLILTTNVTNQDGIIVTEGQATIMLT